MIDTVTAVTLAVLGAWSLAIAYRARCVLRDMDTNPEPPERPYPPRLPNPNGDSR